MCNNSHDRKVRDIYSMVELPPDIQATLKIAKVSLDFWLEYCTNVFKLTSDD